MVILLAAIAWGVSSLILSAQQDETRAFELSAISVSKAEIPPIFYQKVDPETQERTYRKLQVGDFARGAYASIPTSGSSQLYTGTFDENDRPQLETFLDLPSAQKDDRWLLLFYQDSEGQVQYKLVDESGTKHPALAVRFINTSNTNVAVSIDGNRVLVPGESDQIIASDLTPNERFPFTYAVKTSADNVYRAPKKNLRIRFPDQRMMMIYTALPQFIQKDSFPPKEEPDYEVVFRPTCFRLYDEIPQDS